MGPFSGAGGIADAPKMAGTESGACGVVGQGGFSTSSLPKPVVNDELRGSKDIVRGPSQGTRLASYIIEHRR